MKQVKLLSVLVILLIALTALVYFDEWKTEKEENIKEQENKLAVFSPDFVNEIEYTSVQKDENNQAVAEKPVHVRLKKNATGIWELVEPVQAKASPTIADDLFTTLLNYKYEKKVGKGNFAEFGLTEPSRKVTFTFAPEAKQEPLTILIGAKAPVGYSVYLATSVSDDIYVGGQYLMVSLGKNLNEFRDKAIATVIQDDISQFTYERSGQTPILFSKTNGNFQITQPQTLETDQGSVTSLLGALADAKAEDFIDDPSQDFASIFSASSLLATVTWSDSKGAESKVMFAENHDSFYASSNPNKVIFKLANTEKDKFTKTLMDFRDKQIVKFAANRLAKLEVDGKVFVPLAGDWYPEEETERNKDNTLVAKKDAKKSEYIKSFILDMEIAQTLDFFDFNPEVVADLSHKVPLHIVKIFPENNQEKIVTAEFFAALGDFVNVRTSEGKFLYLVKRNLIEPLQLKEAYKPSAPTQDLPPPDDDDHDHGHMEMDHHDG